MFGNDSGLCIRGDVILRHDDPSGNWLTVRNDNTLSMLL